MLVSRDVWPQAQPKLTRTSRTTRNFIEALRVRIAHPFREWRLEKSGSAPAFRCLHECNSERPRLPADERLPRCCEVAPQPRRRLHPNRNTRNSPTLAPRDIPTPTIPRLESAPASRCSKLRAQYDSDRRARPVLLLAPATTPRMCFACARNTPAVPQVLAHNPREAL